MFFPMNDLRRYLTATSSPIKGTTILTNVAEKNLAFLINAVFEKRFFIK